MNHPPMPPTLIAFQSVFEAHPNNKPMQGLPFDDPDFPPASTPASNWDQSPRVPLPQQLPQPPPPQLEEELYRFVAAPEHPQQPHHHHQDDILRYSHLRHRDLQYHRLQNALPSRRSQRPQQQQHPQLPRQLDASSQHATPPPPPPPQAQAQAQAQPQSQPSHPAQQQASPALSHALHQRAAALPGDTLPKASKRPKRSAVEEARMRAQREAETFANSRRDPTKREHSLQQTSSKSDEAGMPAASHAHASRGSKRTRAETEPNSSAEYRPRGSGSGDDRVEDSEAEKKERYKRRLDMNRESAAVSRVRRRAYVKELEERLAGVEAEKLQLEGKLEVMMSQNEGLKKQLDNLFMMVASGRRPVYPGEASGQPPGSSGETG